MNLSAETFQSIIESIRSDQSEEFDAEKRTQPRVGLRGRVTIIPCFPGRSGKPVIAMVRDISVSGLCILHDQPIKAGQQFIVCLTDAQARTTRAILCTSVRWQPLDERLFAIGATYTRELSPHTLSPAIKLTQPSAP
ncbi:MAG: PilZ domain-containing protein [Tepidisphaeraceae bacterium]